MALPTWVAFGAVEGSIASLTPTMPAGVLGNDILLLAVETTPEDAGATLSTPNGFAEVGTYSPQDSNVAGGTMLNLFWKRATGSDAAPVIADAGDHVVSCVAALRGCKTSGNPWNIGSGGQNGPGSATSITVPGATTSAADCLVVVVATHHGDTAAAQFSAWANASLANITEQVDAGSTQGNGGGIAFVTGEKASAGAYGNTTATVGFSATCAYITLALEGAAAVGTDARTWRNVEAGASGPSVAVSEQSRVGFFGGYSGRG